MNSVFRFRIEPNCGQVAASHQAFGGLGFPALTVKDGQARKAIAATSGQPPYSIRPAHIDQNKQTCPAAAKREPGEKLTMIEAAMGDCQGKAKYQQSGGLTVILRDCQHMCQSAWKLRRR
jgi:hypothetical protein